MTELRDLHWGLYLTCQFRYLLLSVQTALTTWKLHANCPSQYFKLKQQSDKMLIKFANSVKGKVCQTLKDLCFFSCTYFHITLILWLKMQKFLIIEVIVAPNLCLHEAHFRGNACPIHQHMLVFCGEIFFLLAMLTLLKLNHTPSLWMHWWSKCDQIFLVQCVVKASS